MQKRRQAGEKERAIARTGSELVNGAETSVAGREVGRWQREEGREIETGWQGRGDQPPCGAYADFLQMNTMRSMKHIIANRMMHLSVNAFFDCFSASSKCFTPLCTFASVDSML